MNKILFLAAFIVSFSLSGQSVLDLKLDGALQGQGLLVYFSTLEKKHEVKFYYLEEWVAPLVFNEPVEGQSLREVLDQLFYGTPLGYLELDPHTVIIVKDPTDELNVTQHLRAARNEGKEIRPVTIGDPAKAVAGRPLRITGVVKDRKSDLPMAGVSIIASGLKAGATTRDDGTFELQLPTGSHVLTFSYMNFDDAVVDLQAYASGAINVEMEETPTLLEEVTVTGRSGEITTALIGETRISMKEIKRAPALLGEVDLIRQIQNLPGISTTGEAASGFNVRGGSVDQNLILYDGLPVFNSSHVFGFFSTFNAEAIRDVTFYRSNVPAEFGGRISSVLDIQSKEGDMQTGSLSGGIGMISSNIMVSGPLRKGQSSAALSFRSSYSDWLINTIRSNYIDLENSSASFYDGTLKVVHKFSEKTRITWSGYASHDQFRLEGDSTYNWDNLISSLRLDHAFRGNLTASILAGFGQYSYLVADDDRFSGFDLSYRIAYPTGKLDFNLQLGKHNITFGSQVIYYGFNPGNLEPKSESNRKSIQIEQQRSVEGAVYVGDQFQLSGKLHLDLGLRFSGFAALGPSNINRYQPDAPREVRTIMDTLRFEAGDVVASFYRAEPRLGFRYDLGGDASLKLGVNRTYQYLHLITNTTAITPIDIWQPSGYYFQPQYADQLSFGYFRTLSGGTYEGYAEVFYKQMQNVLDYKDGATLLLNPQLEADLLQGTARAYGVETQISKKAGRMTGVINYTYSRSFRTIDGKFSEEKINDGREYPSNFDQPHILNISWKYSLSKRHFFTGGFTYHTGRPITLPLSTFLIEDVPVSSFSARNEFRVPDYHRLDLGFVVEGNHKRKKLFDGTWTFSIYNVYARKNAYSVFFKEVSTGALRPYRLAIIGTALPSVSYSFKI